MITKTQRVLPTRRRRLLCAAAIAISVTMASLLSACGNTTDPGASASSAPQTVNPNQKYNLTYWSWTKGSEQAVDAFNAAHPNIHVTYAQIPSGSAGGYAKLSNAFKAGNGPDVFNVEYGQLPSFVAAGQVADISSYMTSAVKADYLPQSMALTTLGDKTWAVPYDVGVQIMYYRADLFKKYGLAVPTTWAQYEADAQKLKQANPSAYLTNYTVDDPATLAALSWQAGAQWFTTSGDSWKVDFADASSEQVASYWQGMIDKGLVANVPSGSQGYTADVAKGTILTEISASWNAAYIQSSFPNEAGKWAAAPLPSFSGTPSSGMVGGSSYAVASTSKNTAADVEFATWMTSQTAAVQPRVEGGTSSPYLSNSNALAVAKKNFSSSYYSGQNLYSTFSTAAAGLKPWTWGPTMTGTNAAMSDAGKKLQSGGTVASILQAGQQDALSEMKSLGLSVSAGSR